ncbi:hypothetical protein [Plantactinospora endophytica]|uniref:hypothetical protein n=1 Tax=Plantactinospora endophytica TaxID=673535 RepID=UPI0019418FC4|nr:hypothetical protein [Plantactinospora endophytica]
MGLVGNPKLPPFGRSGADQAADHDLTTLPMITVVGVPDNRHVPEDREGRS